MKLYLCLLLSFALIPLVTNAKVLPEIFYGPYYEFDSENWFQYLSSLRTSVFHRFHHFKTFTIFFEENDDPTKFDIVQGTVDKNLTFYRGIELGVPFSTVDRKNNKIKLIFTLKDEILYEQPVDEDNKPTTFYPSEHAFVGTELVTTHFWHTRLWSGAYMRRKEVAKLYYYRGFKKTLWNRLFS